MRILTVDQPADQSNQTAGRGGLRHAFVGRVSPLALRPTLAAAGMVIGCGVLSAPAYANCSFPVGGDVVCDGTTGSPINTTGIINFDDVALINGQVDDAANGLTVTSSVGDLDVSLDATSAVNNASTNNALTITASAGNISSTTPYGSGINGTLTSTGGDGLHVSNTFAGGDIVIVQGATGNFTGSNRGIYMEALGGAGSLIDLTVNGTVTGQGGAGVQLGSNDVILFKSSGTITGTTFGVNGSSSGNSNYQILGGSVSGGVGVWVNAGNGSSNSVATGATVTGTTGNGYEVNAGREVTMANNGSITGATNGFVGTAGAAASSGSSITGSGSFTAQNGTAVLFTNNSAQNTTVNLTGTVTATNGHGIQINDTASGGDISVTAGTVTAATAGWNGVSVVANTTAGDVSVTTNGTVTAGNAGIVAALINGGATGDITVNVNGPMNARWGVDAENRGSGTTTVTATGPITTTSGVGLYASSNGGDVTATSGDITSSGSLGVWLLQTNAGGAGVVTANSNGDVSGTTGIQIDNSGTGATNVVQAAGTSITGTSGHGIALATDSSDTSIHVNGSITGAVHGISGTSNTGDIVVTVTSTGTIDPLIGVNLSTVSGALVVNNAGLIEGDQSGVVLNSSGAGAVGNLELNQSGTGITRVTNVGGGAQAVLMNSVDANQIVTGNGASTSINAANGTIALEMATTGLGSITITDNTIVGATGGVKATQTGAATTGITVNGTGGISTATGTAVAMTINNAANTGTISYTRTGAVSGQAGINAVIQAGTGSITVSPVGNVTATAGTAINAQISDFNVNNASVTVTTSAGSTVAASGGNGINVTNSSDGTGTITVTNAATMQVSAGAGISVLRNVGDGNTTITSTGSIGSGTGGPNTLGTGIFAFHNPGADGDITVNLTGANIGSGTDRAQGGGISIQSGGSANLGDMNVNLANASIWSVNQAVRAVTNGVGDINVIGTGTGTLNSSANLGVQAQKVNGNSGNVLVDLTQNVVGQTGGIAASTPGSGNVTVTARGTVTTVNGVGIDAQATGSGATGLVTVNANNSVSGSTGVRALNAGTGNVVVNANAGVTGFSGPGINAALTNAADQGNSITVNVAAGTITAGNLGAGVVTDLGQSTGTATVNLNGRATGTSGVSQTAVAGANDVIIASTGRADGVTGVSQTNGTGTSLVNNAGLIVGSTTGVSQAISGTGNTTVWNTGTITGTTWGVNATLGGGAHLLANNATGTINGPVSVTGSNVGTSLFANAGTWNTSAASTYHGTWQNNGTTNAAAGSSITVTGPSLNGLSGVIRFAGNGTMVTNLTNGGLIDARNGTAGQIITHTGNYVGATGNIGLDVALATATADRYNISGTATGTTNVAITLLSQGVLPTGFLPLVTVGTGTPAATAFTSTTVLPATGVLTETFGVNPANANQFGIIQSFNPRSSQLTQLTTLADSVSMMVDDPVSALVTDRTDRSNQIGLWARGSAGDFNQNLSTAFSAVPTAVTVNDRASTSYHVLQTGLDFGLLGLGGGNFNVHLGVMGGHYGASSKVSGGLTTISTDYLGGYIVITGGGFALDANVRKEWRDYTIDNALVIANTRASTEGTATAGSVGASYKLGFSQGFFIKPEASYHWGKAKTDPFSIDALTVVAPGDDTSGVIRYGGTIGWEGNVSPDLILMPYVGVYGLNSSSNTASTTLNFGASSLTTVTTGFDNAMQVVGGLNMHNEKNSLGAFVRGGFYTSNGVKGASFSVGARINF